MSQKGFAPILIIILVAAVILGGGYLYFTNQSKPPQKIACTADAMICPDGTAVGRTGPNCEFAACPTPKESTSSADMTDWKTYTSDKYSFTIKHPDDWYNKEEIVGNSERGTDSDQTYFALGIGKGDRFPSTVSSDYPNLNVIVYENANLDDKIKSSIQDKSDQLDIIQFAGQTATKISHFNSTNPELVSPSYTNIITQKNSNIFVFYYPVIKSPADSVIINQILSTFKFTDTAPAASCMPRPACLDATPRCLLPEPAEGWCP